LASLKFMAKLKVSIYFSVQLKFCIFQCDLHLASGLCRQQHYDHVIQ